MVKLLSEFSVGETGTVKKIKLESRLRRRLLDMGITSGTSISLLKKAPLGDPFEISVRGYQLILRKDEAALIVMEVGI